MVTALRKTCSGLMALSQSTTFGKGHHHRYFNAVAGNNLGAFG
jgi:hypothetical protein